MMQIHRNKTYRGTEYLRPYFTMYKCNGKQYQITCYSIAKSVHAIREKRESAKTCKEQDREVSFTQSPAGQDHTSDIDNLYYQEEIVNRHSVSTPEHETIEKPVFTIKGAWVIYIGHIGIGQRIVHGITKDTMDWTQANKIDKQQYE